MRVRGSHTVEMVATSLVAIYRRNLNGQTNSRDDVNCTAMRVPNWVIEGMGILVLA